MKKYIVLLISMLALSGGAAAQSVGGDLLGAKSEVRNFEYRADSVFVDMVLDLSDVDFSSKQSVVFEPFMCKGDQRLDMPSVVVRGRNSARSYMRSVALNNDDKVEAYESFYAEPYMVIDNYGDEADEFEASGRVVDYHFAVPYETWMVDSEVYLSCSTHSCCDVSDNGVCAPDDNQLSIAMLSVEEFTPSPKVSLIKPEPVAIKRRDIEYSSKLIFRVNSSYIDPKLENNEEELNSIRSMMESVISDSDYTVTAVNIAGYASPEGTLQSNQLLSERRAKALETILKRDYELNHNLYNVEFGGENWDGLIPIIEQGDMEEKEDVLDIIRNVSIMDGRESKIMALKWGAPYRYMLKNYFPAVRLVVVEVEYNVDAYDLERIAELIDVKPENLSLEEIYRLSETYDVDSDEFTDLFLTAVKVYPNDQVALHNALVTDLTIGDVDAASLYATRIDESTSHGSIANALGAYYLMEGDYPKAQMLLEKAKSLGSSEADYNLGQLDLKLQNIDDIKASEELNRKIYGE